MSAQNHNHIVDVPTNRFQRNDFAGLRNREPGFGGLEHGNHATTPQSALVEHMSTNRRPSVGIVGFDDQLSFISRLVGARDNNSDNFSQWNHRLPENIIGITGPDVESGKRAQVQCQICAIGQRPLVFPSAVGFVVAESSRDVF